MKKHFLALTAAITLFSSIPEPVQASGYPVVDWAAIAKLVEQINQFKTMIDELNTLTKYADLDHVNLAGNKFRRFLTQYTKLFDDIIKEIDSYQGGGLLGQIDRLDEVYFPYHEGWEDRRENEQAEMADPLHRKLAKQILFTRIQLKHAAKVGAKIRESLPKTQAQINGFLDDTAQAVGVMQSIKIGNELIGTVAKSVQTLNVSLTEQIQAQAAQGLEANHKEGLKMNRAKEAISDWGTDSRPSQPAKKNPFEGY